MAATVPFQVITASVSGKGLSFQITTTSQPGSLDSTGGYAPSLLVSFAVPSGASGNMAYLRLSPEATPTATINDIPIPQNTVHLFANPVPTGKLGVAVIVSVSSTLGPAVLCVTPGEGGIS